MPWVDPRAPTCSVDITTDQFAADPISGYNRIRLQGPIVWQQQSRGFLLTRYSDTGAALRDSHFVSPDLTAGWQHIQQKLGRDYSDAIELFSFMPFILEGSRHTWMRRSFALGIAPLADGSPAIQKRVSNLVANALKDGGFDLAKDFAGRLLFEIVCDLLDFPEADRQDLESFAKISWALEAVLPIRDRDMAAATMRETRAALIAHIERLIRAGPKGWVKAILESLPEDISNKAHATATIAAIMLMMGNDAIGMCIAASVQQLKNAQPWVAQADWPRLSDDAIRFSAPVDFLNRIATEDVTVCGCSVRRGERIILSPMCANHDPEEFGDETETISVKPGKTVGLTFGAGSHMCVGNRFSRTIVRMGLAALAVLPEFRITGPATQRRGKIVRTLSSLPVEFV